MARVTIEDCRGKLDNIFELVIIAAERAKAIAAGSKPLVERDNDKDPVIALREIATDKVDALELRKAVVNKFRKQRVFNETEDIPEDHPDSDEINQEMQRYQSEVATNAEVFEGYEDISDEEAPPEK